MVVNVSLFPPHIQVEIAKRLRFFDFVNFEMSSMAGRRIGKLSKPVCPILCVDLDKDKAILHICIPDIDGGYKSEGWRKAAWEKIKHMDLPRFSVNDFEIRDDVTPERVDAFCNEMNPVGEKVGLRFWKKGDDQYEVFTRIAERFRITDMQLCHHQLDQAILLSPLFLELTSYDTLHTTVPDEIFLQMKAGYIKGISLKNLENGSTFNKFFQQWYRGERRIRLFKIHVHKDDKTINPEHLFADLPYELIWSSEEHTTFLIGRGDRHLLVDIDLHFKIRICAKEINEEEYQMRTKIPLKREQKQDIQQKPEIITIENESPTKINPCSQCTVC